MFFKVDPNSQIPNSRAKIKSGLDPTVGMWFQQLFEDPMVKFHPNFDPTATNEFQR